MLLDNQISIMILQNDIPLYEIPKGDSTAYICSETDAEFALCIMAAADCMHHVLLDGVQIPSAFLENNGRCSVRKTVSVDETHTRTFMFLPITSLPQNEGATATEAGTIELQFWHAKWRREKRQDPIQRLSFSKSRNCSGDVKLKTMIGFGEPVEVEPSQWTWIYTQGEFIGKARFLYRDVFGLQRIEKAVPDSLESLAAHCQAVIGMKTPIVVPSVMRTYFGPSDDVVRLKDFNETVGSMFSSKAPLRNCREQIQRVTELIRLFRQDYDEMELVVSNEELDVHEAMVRMLFGSLSDDSIENHLQVMRRVIEDELNRCVDYYVYMLAKTKRSAIPAIEERMNTLFNTHSQLGNAIDDKLKREFQQPLLQLLAFVNLFRVNVVVVLTDPVSEKQKRVLLLDFATAPLQSYCLGFCVGKFHEILPARIQRTNSEEVVEIRRTGKRENRAESSSTPNGKRLKSETQREVVDLTGE